MSESQEQNQDTKDRIQYLTKQIKLNRSLRYHNPQQISEKECDELEDELRKLDPKNPLFYGIINKEKKIKRFARIFVILGILAVFLVVLFWYFYMFRYNPLVYPYN
ncbi:MAG: hypothetical protein ACXAAI_15045 [Promethearchaeota archaeon]|jgi:hypothetical protein